MNIIAALAVVRCFLGLDQTARPKVLKSYLYLRNKKFDFEDKIEILFFWRVKCKYVYLRVKNDKI